MRCGATCHRNTVIHYYISLYYEWPSALQVGVKSYFDWQIRKGRVHLTSKLREYCKYLSEGQVQPRSRNQDLIRKYWYVMASANRSNICSVQPKRGRKTPKKRILQRCNLESIQKTAGLRELPPVVAVCAAIWTLVRKQKQE